MLITLAIALESTFIFHALPLCKSCLLSWMKENLHHQNFASPKVKAQAKQVLSIVNLGGKQSTSYHLSFCGAHLFSSKMTDRKKICTSTERDDRLVQTLPYYQRGKQTPSRVLSLSACAFTFGDAKFR